MDTQSITLIISIGCLILLSAYFSATETAFSTINKIRLKNLEKGGNRRAALILSIAEDYDKMLSAILIGNNIVNIASASLATIIFTKYFGNSGVTLSTIVMTVLVLIFGEISPKSLAKEEPEKFAMFSAPILRFLMWIMTPVTFLFGLWKKLLSLFFKAKERPSVTEEELLTIVDVAENEGELNANQGDLIRSAIEFNDLDVKDILTPRVNLVCVEEHTPLEEVRKQFANCGYSRLPVYAGSVDSIIGVIHEKDFFRMLDRGETDIHSAITDIVCTAPNMKISELLHTLQHSKIHMAVVVDEFGGTLGIVTLEDILEELVGEIWDEHDEVVEYFRQEPGGAYQISCKASLEEMFELFGLENDNDKFENNTVGGWVIEVLGRIPEQGAQFQYENLHVTVTKADPKKALEIFVEPQEQQAMAVCK